MNMQAAIKQYLKMCLQSSGPSTRANYGYCLSDFNKMYGRRKLSSIKMIDIEKFLYTTKKTEKRNNSYYNYRLSIIRSFFNYLLAHDIIDKSPCIQLKSKKVNRFASMKILSKDEVLYILRRIKRDHELAHDAIFLMWELGLRIEECASLRRENLKQLNINDKRTWCILIKGKGNKVRRLLPNEEVVRLYIKRMNRVKHLKNEPLFPSNKNVGEPVSAQSLYYYIKEALKYIGSSKVTPHWFRHSFANNLAVNGADINKIRHSLGHSDLGTTQRYLDDMYIVDLRMDNARKVQG